MCGRYEIVDGQQIFVRFGVANAAPEMLANLDVRPTQLLERYPAEVWHQVQTDVAFVRAVRRASHTPLADQPLHEPFAGGLVLHQAESRGEPPPHIVIRRQLSKAAVGIADHLGNLHSARVVVRVGDFPRRGRRLGGDLGAPGVERRLGTPSSRHIHATG